ncbi:hypothetical protein [Absidia glauca]|uniref:Uncharacterized protein n=1 Tax=Absidia glauca TaxID=4829 RepID=A0A168MBA2_ABSGL|nr:hypothetical protein [Absidia glauca]
MHRPPRFAGYLKPPRSTRKRKIGIQKRNLPTKEEEKTIILPLFADHFDIRTPASSSSAASLYGSIYSSLGTCYTLKLRLIFPTPTCQASHFLTIQPTALLLVTNVAALCFQLIIFSFLAPLMNKDTILNFRRPRPQNPKPRPYPDSPPPVSNGNSPMISVENLDSPVSKKVKWFFCFPLVHSGSRRSPPH